VERHHPRIVRLTFTGPGETDETLLFAGKGITYDTGGADVKYGGHMAGMHMDKGGAAGIAGFVKTVSLLKPKGLKVVAELGFVRNSIGSDSYVSDEIVRSHGGKRVMVANTDAEGRMVLADCLSHMREVALQEKNPRLMTCATLTGHAHRAVGNYGITLDNGPAFAIGQSVGLQKASLAWGDPFEVSTLRREDYAFIQPKNAAFDVLQCNLAPSSGTARGHQFPAAFLVIASGLEAHGSNSKDKHLPFSHLDIAGNAAEDDDYQFGRPTATPVVPLTARYVLGRL
jgi:leucyl aminopeptidase